MMHFAYLNLRGLHRIIYYICNITHQTTPPYAVRQNIRVYALYTQTKPWCCRIIIKPLQCVCVDSQLTRFPHVSIIIYVWFFLYAMSVFSSTSPRFRWDSRALRANIFTHPPPLLLQIHDNGRYTHTQVIYTFLYVWVCCGGFPPHNFELLYNNEASAQRTLSKLYEFSFCMHHH